MKCPHCMVEVNSAFAERYITKDSEGIWSMYYMICPNQKCGKLIVDLGVGDKAVYSNNIAVAIDGIKDRFRVKPITSSRTPVPPEVEKPYSDDYSEACLILTFSPKASAALSRRCLQSILRDKAKVKKGDLANEIQQVITTNALPSHLAESIDAIRNIGNFAAHPLKSTSTGEIVEVEFGEAEWLLDVLEALFDFYFVQPTILKAKRDALNVKLAAIGKPPMK